MDLEWRLNMVTADRNLLENSNAKLESENAALASQAADLAARVAALEAEAAGLRELALSSGQRALQFEALSSEALEAASRLQADKEALEGELRASGGGGGAPGRAAARVAAALSGGGSGIPSPGSAGASRRGTPRATGTHEFYPSTATGGSLAGSFSSTPRALAAPGLHALRTGAGGGLSRTPSFGSAAGLRRAPSGGGDGGASPRARAAALLSAGPAFSEQLQSKLASGRSAAGTPRRTGTPGPDMVSALRTGSGYVSAGAPSLASGAGGLLSSAACAASRIPTSPSGSARPSAGGGSGGSSGGGAAPLRASLGGGGLSALYTAPAGAHTAAGELRGFADGLRRSSGALPTKGTWANGIGRATAEAPGAPLAPQDGLPAGRRARAAGQLPAGCVTAA
jgi:hypothetical protein